MAHQNLNANLDFGQCGKGITMSALFIRTRREFHNTETDAVLELDQGDECYTYNCIKIIYKISV